jgi:hypothetical protein
MLAEVKVSVVERRSVDFYEEVGGPGDGCWDGAELEAEKVVSCIGGVCGEAGREGLRVEDFTGIPLDLLHGDCFCHFGFGSGRTIDDLLCEHISQLRFRKEDLQFY